jgi:hypothetical protein
MWSSNVVSSCMLSCLLSLINMKWGCEKTWKDRGSSAKNIGLKNMVEGAFWKIVCTNLQQTSGDQWSDSPLGPSSFWSCISQRKIQSKTSWWGWVIFVVFLMACVLVGETKDLVTGVEQILCVPALTPWRVLIFLIILIIEYKGLYSIDRKPAEAALAG